MSGRVVKLDSRKYARQTIYRLVIGFLVLLFVVGDGLIYIFYGQGAALLGLLCLLAGMIPVIGVVFFFWISKRILDINR